MIDLVQVYNVIKELKALTEKYKNSEMSQKVVEIQSAFFDMREAMQDLREENSVLRDEIKELKACSEIENDLELLPEGYYIRKSEKGQQKQPIYCVACWQNRHKLYPLVSVTYGNIRQCCNCNAVIRYME